MTGIKLLVGYAVSAISLPLVPVFAQSAQLKTSAEWLGVASAQVILAATTVALAAALVWMTLRKDKETSERIEEEKARAREQVTLVREVTAALLDNSATSRELRTASEALRVEIGKCHDARVKAERGG